MAIQVVTGAFSYTGGYIARRLLAQGDEVRSLSRGPAPSGHPLEGKVGVEKLQFIDEDALVRSIEGADTLYNTYWIRFPHEGSSFEAAVENSSRLFRAAERAGVRRIVHISVTHATDPLPYPYFRGKAAVERALAESPVPSAVVRPSLIFGGREEILINNIAWLLRRAPFFLLPGDGRYRLQPVAVQDVAEIAVSLGAGDERVTLDAVGPQVFTFRGFVRTIARAVGSHAAIVGAPVPLVLPLTRILGALVNDVLVTPSELGAMMDEVMLSTDPPTGATRFSEWLSDNRDWLGRSYAHELRRNWSSPA